VGALRVQVLDLVPFAGELVQSLLEQRVALHVPAGDGPAALRRLDPAFNRAPGSATRFAAAFEIREYDANAALNIHGLSFSFAPTAHPLSGLSRRRRPMPRTRA
jgi:hypothetical protein